MRPPSIRLRLLLPMLSAAVGRKELELALDGRTVGDLVRQLVSRYGQRARDALLDEQGQLDLEVQLLINRTTWINRDQLDTALDDGDEVMILMLMAGG